MVDLLFIFIFISILITISASSKEYPVITKLLCTVADIVLVFMPLALIGYERVIIKRFKAEKALFTACVIISVAAATLFIVNFFVGFLFKIGGDGQLVTVGSGIIIPAILTALFLLPVIFVLFSSESVKQKLTMLSFSLFHVLLCVILLAYSGKDTLRSVESGIAVFAMLLAIFVIYLTFQVERSGALLLKDNMLKESQMLSIMQRMNPHFVSNTLASIAALNEIDPQRATDLTVMFSKYLRANYTDFAGEHTLPFSTEIEHLKNYIYIEKARFPGIEVEFNLGVTDFKIPTLTLQPLVENAINHGIRKKIDCNGKITIETSEDEGSVYIYVTDDGVGYNPVDDGKKHIGIENTCARLKMLCGGKLSVKGEEGKGTVCEIVIPKNNGGNIK